MPQNPFFLRRPSGVCPDWGVCPCQGGRPTRKLPPTNLSNAQKTNVSLRLIPVAIVIFRYVLVCHAVHCQNIGGERPLWRIVSFQCWESQLIIIPFLELQICFCLLSLCMASGSLIFFTFDINLTYLVCNGQEELFRYLLPNKNKHRQHERPIDINDNVPRGKSTL